MKKLKQLKPRFNMDLPKYADLREMLNGSAERFADKTAFIIKHKKKPAYAGFGNVIHLSIR